MIKNIPGDKMFELVRQWEIDNPQTEEVVEEVVEEGKQNDSQPAGADVDQKESVAPVNKDTESTSVDGSLESLDDFNISTFQNSQRSKGYTLSELNTRLEPEQSNRDAVAQYEQMTIVAKPEESYTEGSYDYKYNFTDDGPMYYAKEKGTEKWEAKDVDSDAYLNIQSLFGHNSLDRKKIWRS